MRKSGSLFVRGVFPLVLGLMLAGCALFDDELPESCVVIEEVKQATPDKVVIDTAMEVRLYPVKVSFIDRMESSSGDLENSSVAFGKIRSEVIARETDNDREWKEFLARLCEATWPVGSSCIYMRALGKLRVRNTPENLALIDKVMEELNREPDPELLEVQVRFIRVAQKTLDELGTELVPSKKAGCRYDLADFDAVPVGELERRLVSRHDLLGNEASRVLTPSDHEAACKSVTECRYPQDFDVAVGEMAYCGSNKVTQVRQFGFAAVEPQNFEVREIGTKLCVTPTLSDDGHTVTIHLDSQIVTPPEWKDYGAQLPAPNGGTYGLPMEQPFFPVRSVDATLYAALDETLLVSARVATGKTDETELVFLRIRKLSLKSEQP